MHRIRAITLDLDDTLWEIEPVIRHAEEELWHWLEQNFPRIPRRFPADALYELREQIAASHPERSHDFRFLRREVLAQVAVACGYSTDLVDPAFDVFDRARNRVELYPDVIPALESLGCRYALIAVTNGNASLSRIGVRHLFHDVVTAVDAGAAKPARSIFDRAVRRAGVDRRHVVHVGDHPENDIYGARCAGLRAVWLNRNGHPWPAHLDAPDATIKSMTELQELLAAANRGDV